MGRDRRSVNGEHGSEQSGEGKGERISAFEPAHGPAMFPSSRDGELRRGGSELDWFCCQNDGWLRLVPHVDDDLLYIKWKWSSGEFQGMYVMVRVTPWQVVYGLVLLRQKVEEVQDHIRTPVLDTPWTTPGG
jgi:hypothetical protein